jgi:catechol 2,3-dioxygenase-like lactoylglutathione lyase family enzyme
MITEITFTGTPVTDIKRAREFYEGVLGLNPAMESAGGIFAE